MRRLFVLLMAIALVVSAVPVSFAMDQYKETPLDQAWDWATTLGKSGMEKDQILAKNKAERMQRYSEQMAKKAQKDANKAGKDLKGKLGLREKRPRHRRKRRG